MEKNNSEIIMPEFIRRGYLEYDKDGKRQLKKGAPEWAKKEFEEYMEDVEDMSDLFD